MDQVHVIRHKVLIEGRKVRAAARATRVVRFMINRGIPMTKLKAVGYGESQPTKPNRDSTGRPIPQNQAANRRIVVNIHRTY